MILVVIKFLKKQEIIMKIKLIFILLFVLLVSCKTQKNIIIKQYEISEGLRGVENNNNLWGFQDSFGKLVIDFKFDDVRPFLNNYATVKINNKWGVIDKKGKYKIEPKYEFAVPSNENLILVKINGKYGFIDYDDKVVIKPNYIMAGIFNEGLAAVAIRVWFKTSNSSGFSGGFKTLWGYINKSGKYIISPKYVKADYFENGFAIVVLTQNGKEVSKRINKVGQFK